MLMVGRSFANARSVYAIPSWVTPPGEIMEVLQIYLRLERPLTNSPSLYSSR
jgi:hypothetical protein